MYKEDLALNNLQWLICHKAKTNLFLKIMNKRVEFKIPRTGIFGGVLSVIFIVVENGIGNPSSNPKPSCLCFTLC